MNNLNEEYLTIVNDILNHTEFLKLKNCKHHGTNRYEHSKKVSYGAYKIAKKYKLSYKEVARSALLHDFFINEKATFKERVKATFSHPLEAENNSREIFNINEKEAKIIRSHMFPINLTLPRDKESWVVTICDKVVCIEEYFQNVFHKLSYGFNILIILLVNFIK